MSDNAPVIVNGIGSPRAWLFTNDGEPLRDFDEQIIAKFLEKFKYTYNEEEDDECVITFMFPTLRSFDLPYFQQDVILNVEWGYIVTDGTVIKSPRRKVAIRDIETDYKKDGIEVTVKCTDIVSYLKGMKTQRVNQYRTIQTGATTGSPIQDVQSKGSKELEDIFYDDLLNGSNNQMSVSKTIGNKTTVINKKGEVKTGIKNPKTGKFQPVSNNKPVWTGGNNKAASAVIPLKDKATSNLGNKTFDRALKAKLKWINQLDKVSSGAGINSLSDSDGPTIADGTDDNLEIKTRNFNQPIFKQFTYYGGSGELLSFKVSTETRKNKENKTISSGVDPYSKKIISHHVDTTDTSRLNQTKGKTIGQLLQQKAPPSKKFDESLLKETFDDRKNAYQKSIAKVDPSILPKKKYTQTRVTYNNNVTPYMGYKPKQTQVQTFEATEILASADFKDYANQHRNPELKSFDPSSNGSGLKRVLTGYSIETIQRKYTATAETIGDPSLIKGKVYFFNNLGRLDKGKWYATSIEHNLEMDKGYTCSMGLMKNPVAIGISAKTYSANPTFDRITGDITIEEETEVNESVIYNQVNEENDITLGNMDNVEQENRYRQEDPIGDMDNRLNFLMAEDDSFRELADNEEFKIETSNNYITKPKPNSHLS